jgi:hypothetical protein
MRINLGINSYLIFGFNRILMRYFEPVVVIINGKKSKIPNLACHEKIRSVVVVDLDRAGTHAPGG